MKAKVVKGELVRVNTDKEVMGIINERTRQEITLPIDADITLPDLYVWEDLITRYIEAVLVNGKVSIIYLKIKEGY